VIFAPIEQYEVLLLLLAAIASLALSDKEKAFYLIEIKM
jgi:hypothetical protein